MAQHRDLQRLKKQTHWGCRIPRKRIGRILQAAAKAPAILWFARNYVKTPLGSASLSLSRFLDLDLADDRLDSASWPRLLLRLDRLFFDCRYFLCMSALRLRLLVNKIPVNMTKDATSSIPPATYLSFVTQDLEPACALAFEAEVVFVELSIEDIASSFWHRELSNEEQLSE